MLRTYQSFNVQAPHFLQTSAYATLQYLLYSGTTEETIIFRIYPVLIVQLRINPDHGTGRIVYGKLNLTRLHGVT